MAGRRGIRRVARVAVWTLLGVLGIVFGLVLALLFAVHTDWGRERVVERAERELQPFVRGDLEIGSLSGSVLGRFTLDDVVVRDREGRAIISIEQVAIDYAPLSLLRRRLDLRLVALARPDVRARIDDEGRLNVAEVFDFPEPDPDVEPLAVAVDDLVIAGGSVEIEAPGADRAIISELDVRASGRADPADDDYRARVSEAAAEVAIPARGVAIPVSAGGAASLRGDRIQAEGVRAGVGASALRIPAVESDARGGFEGDVELEVRAADLEAFLGDTGWIGDAELAGSLARERAGAPVAIDLRGEVAGAAARAEAAIGAGADRADFDLALEGVDPSAAARGAPSGDLDAALAGWIRAGDEGEAEGEAEFSADGRIEGWRVGPVEASAHLADGALSASASARAPGGSARADAEIDLSGETPAVTSASLTADIADPDALTRGAAPVSGRAQIDARASGRVDDLEVWGEVSAEDIRTDGVAVDAAEAEAELTGVPSAPAGTAAVEVRGVAALGARLSRAEIDAEIADGGERLAADLRAGGPGEAYEASGRVEAEFQDEWTRASAPRLSVRTRDLTWTADGAAIGLGPGGEIAIDRLEIASEAGRVAARGRARGDEAGDLHVDIDALDLGRARAALVPGAPAIAGVVDLGAELSWPPARGHIEGEIAELELAAAAGAPIPPVDVRIDGEIGDGRVRASLGARAAQQRVEVEVAARAPAPIADPAAWAALGAGSIEELTAEIRALELPPLAEALGESGVESGRVSGRADFGTGLTTGEAELRVDDLSLGEPWPALGAEAELAIAGRGDARVLDVEASAHTLDGQRANAQARIRPPAELFDASAWETLAPERAIAGLDFELSDMHLAPLAEALGAPLDAGSASARLRLGESLERGSLAIDLDGVRAGAHAPSARARIRTRLEGREISADVTARVGDAGDAEISAALELPPERFDAAALADAGPDLVRRAELRARADLDAAARAGDFALPELGGRVLAEVEAGAGLREARARVRARGVESGGQPQPVDADLSLAIEPETMRAEVEAWLDTPGGDGRGPRVASGEGRLEAGSSALWAMDVAALREAEAEAELLARARLRHLGAALDAEVPLSGEARSRIELAGSWDAPRVTAWLDSPDARLARVQFDALRGFFRLEDSQIEGMFRARQRDGNIDVRASVPLDEPAAGALQLVADDFDLGFLAAILAPSPAPILDVGGRLSGDLRARPDLGAPDLEGVLRIDRASLDAPDLRPIRDGRLEIRHADGRAEFEISARSDQGTAEIDGEAALEGLEPQWVNATASARDFPIAAVPEMPIALDFDTRIRGAPREGGLPWEVEVEAPRVVVNLPEADRYRRHLGPVGDLDDVHFVEDAAEPEDDPEPGPEDHEPVTIVSLAAPNDILVRGEEVNAQLATEDVRVTLLRRGAAIEGSVRAVTGHVRLFDRRYDIDRARASFEGRIPPDPRIDVRLSHQFATASLFIDATGTVENPSIRFASDPGIYDQAQLLGFVLGGNPDTGAEPGMEPGLEQRAVGAAGALIAEEVGDVLRRAFPIDVLRIGAEDPAEGVIGFVTVGKWLRDDLFVAYRRRSDPDEGENIHEAMLEYQIYRNWTLEGVAGPDRGSVDLLWIQRY